MPRFDDALRSMPSTHIGRLVHTWQEQGHLCARPAHRATPATSRPGSTVSARPVSSPGTHRAMRR